jgi:hypothetical protein
VQLNASQLQSAVSGISFSNAGGTDASGATAYTGNIDGAAVENSRGVFINNNNTGVGSFSNSQSFNVNNSGVQ